MTGELKRCTFCNKNFKIMEKADVLGNMRPENYVLKKNEYGEEQYFERECWTKFAATRMKNRKQDIRDEFKEMGI